MESDATKGEAKLKMITKSSKHKKCKMMMWHIKSTHKRIYIKHNGFMF